METTLNAVPARRVGAAWGVLGTLAPTVPFFIAGILRAATGLPFLVALEAGIALVILGGWLLARRFRAFTAPWAAAAGVGLTFGFVVSCSFLLGRSPLGALVSAGGGDAGNHVGKHFAWQTSVPGIYEGFVTLYAFCAGLEHLFGLDAYAAFAAAFVVVLWACVVCTLAASMGASSGAVPTAIVRTALLLGVALAFILLPLGSYTQADGFYCHLFGLVPLAALWAAYALTSSRIARASLLLAAVVVHRFTYGLNLGDVCFSSAVVLLVESFQAPRGWERTGLMGAAGAVAFAGLFAYAKLWPLVFVTGSIVPPHLSRLLAGQLLLAASLMAALANEPRGSVSFRLALYAGTFGLINGGVVAGLYLSRIPHAYYLYKYPLHGVVLCVLATVVALATRKGNGRLAPWTLVLSAVGALLVAEGVRPYGAMLIERIRAQPPFELTEPLSDRRATTLIRDVLSERHKRFGGLLAPSWPLMNFMNAELEMPLDWTHQDAGTRQFLEAQLIASPGFCTFWFDPFVMATRTGAEPLPRAAERILTKSRNLSVEVPKTCRAYHPGWSPSVAGQLCFRCF